MSINRKRMYADIEVSPNIGIFWRSGFNMTVTPESIIQERAIICVSWEWEGSDESHSLTWDKNHCDKKLIKKFVKEMNKATELVFHNGDKFDLKWLRTRALFHGVQMNHSYDTIDTLKLAKSGFYFNSNKLDYIAKFLGVGAKLPTGLDLWKKVCLEKCEDSLKQMVEYCEMDVKVLKAVHQKLNPYTKAKTQFAVLRGEEKFCCPECSRLGNYKQMRVTAHGTIQHRMQCSDRKGCGKQWQINNKTYQEFLKFKTKNGIK